ncbi:MAG: hypothetical protein AAB019_07740 [Planctomycetota bacterium]
MIWRKKNQYIVNEKGQKTAAIVPIEKYEEILEEIHDLAVVAERRNESTVPFHEIKKRLKKDGFL